jgi:hypothetical protein
VSSDLDYRRKIPVPRSVTACAAGNQDRTILLRDVPLCFRRHVPHSLVRSDVVSRRSEAQRHHMSDTINAGQVRNSLCDDVLEMLAKLECWPS